MGLDKMTELMKKIPQYNELKDKYSFHMTMGSKIMSSYEKNNWRMSGELEENLVSQVNENGKTIKTADLFSEVLKVLDITKQED